IGFRPGAAAFAVIRLRGVVDGGELLDAHGPLLPAGAGPARRPAPHAVPLVCRDADRAGRQTADRTDGGQAPVLRDSECADRVPAVREVVEEAAVRADRLIEGMAPRAEVRSRA